MTSSDSESQDIKINDETNKLISSDSESQDVKINDETNWLFLFITEETAQQGEIQIFYGHERHLHRSLIKLH